MRASAKILLKAGAVLLGVALFAYLADDIWSRMRGRPVEQMKVDRYYSMLDRWNQIEYSPGTPINQTCVDALMPHLGYVPCWYLRRHTLQQVKIQ